MNVFLCHHHHQTIDPHLGDLYEIVEHVVVLRSPAPPLPHHVPTQLVQVLNIILMENIISDILHLLKFDVDHGYSKQFGNIREKLQQQHVLYIKHYSEIITCSKSDLGNLKLTLQPSQRMTWSQ